MKAKINEIFSSIQGEGPIVGYRQIFIRFCDCNLNCKYCDTEFKQGIEYTAKELYSTITKNYNLETFHSISLTGGEPLLEVDFLEEFLPLVAGKSKIYMETNATLADNLTRIKKYIDNISADIKLKSASGIDTFILHDKFFQNCSGIETFAKIVFNKDITDKEIDECINLGQKYDLELILQPETIGNKIRVESEFCIDLMNKFAKKYKKVRLIPQVHKFLTVR